MPPSTNSAAMLPRRGKRQISHGHMGMREWLENLLDNNSCHGLEWKDKSKNMFTIVWCHASSQGFNEKEHAEVFTLWAEYKGREKFPKKRKRSGKYDSANKSTFRNALHSLPDCQRVPYDTRSKEDPPKRTYKFLDHDDPLCVWKRKHKRETYTRKTIKKMPPKRSCKTLKQEDNKDFICASTSTSCLAHTGKSTFEEKDQDCSSTDQAMLCQESTFDAGAQEERITYMMKSSPAALQGDSEPGETLSLLGLHFETDIDGNTFVICEDKDNQGEIKSEAERTPNSVALGTASLPNFKELGVKDQYESLNYTSSIMFASGGSVSVRKMAAEETEFKEAITLPLPIGSQSGNFFESITHDSNFEDQIVFQEGTVITELRDANIIPQVALHTNSVLFNREESPENGIITASTNILINVEPQQADEHRFNRFIDNDIDDMDFALENAFCSSY